MNNELVQQEHNYPVAIQQEASELSVEEIVQKIEKVREVADRVMKVDIHYGTIPGTNKPTLYKAGAEILGLTFMMAPRYEGERQPVDLGNGHREYIIRCDMYHKTTGRFLGSGVGSCSTMESKYRFRPGPVVMTGNPVPKDYWNFRKSDPKKAQEMIGGKGFSTKKVDGKWEIVQSGEVVENPNIADTYNTVLKIGSKRAYVDATLKATAASEVYTQDMEDMKANDDALFNGQSNGENAPETHAEKSVQQPQRQSASNPDTAAPGIISEAQGKRFFAICSKAGYTEEQRKFILNICGYNSHNDIQKKHYQTMCEFIENTPVERIKFELPSLEKWIKEN